MQNWQTTVQSILTVVIAVSGIMIAQPPSWMTPTASFWVLVVSSVAKITLGVLQKDAPAQGESK